MPLSTDVRVISARLYFLPIRTRLPLKFGTETLTSVTCARVEVTVEDGRGRRAGGWGETPLSVQWVWPGAWSYELRHEALKAFCIRLARAWAGFPGQGHAMEVGHDFTVVELARQWREFNAVSGLAEPMPWLAALVCCSPFDLALHDAYGNLHGRPVYGTYGPRFMNRDLGAFLEPAPGEPLSFAGLFPETFLMPRRADRLLAWHLVGGLDPIGDADLTGGEPQDGYPVRLADWIRRDGLRCLKVKLRGTDGSWDYARLVQVGRVALEEGVQHLSADFNCTVTDPGYVNEVLDRLAREEPGIDARLLYVEQPFPYALEEHRLDVHSVSRRKPLFLDESAHDWRVIRLGRQLGWTGVALKTCKTQTGAILSACWARAHGMQLMVQDLTNPMLAQIPHLLLAAHVATIAGVETNAMQFYPDASEPESRLHPGVYRRRGGEVDLSSVRGAGFGYGGAERARPMPEAAAAFGAA